MIKLVTRIFCNLSQMQETIFDNLFSNKETPVIILIVLSENRMVVILIISLMPMSLKIGVISQTFNRFFLLQYFTCQITIPKYQINDLNVNHDLLIKPQYRSRLSAFWFCHYKTRCVI